MVFDRSVLYAVPEEDDMHEDMRLDVDNMSYEVTLQKIGTLHAKHFEINYFTCHLLVIHHRKLLENNNFGVGISGPGRGHWEC